MKTSDVGLALIQEFEGCELKAYADPASGAEPWTIGVGHTLGVRPGDTCTEDRALEWLRADVGTAERCVNNSVKVDLTQNQFDALVSFVFNLGCGNLGKSTLLRKLNDGDDEGAAREFLVWDKAAGKRMAGLTRRRTAESELFSA